MGTTSAETAYVAISLRLLTYEFVYLFYSIVLKCTFNLRTYIYLLTSTEVLILTLQIPWFASIGCNAKLLLFTPIAMQVNFKQLRSLYP